MKIDRLSIALVSVLSFSLGCDEGFVDDASPAKRGEDVASYNEMSSALQAGLDQLRSQGISGALAELDDGGRRATARSGVARLGDDRPVDQGGYFRMGSNTKTFVAVVLLQLVGEGVLSLEDTVERWLPGVVSGNGNDGTQITLRQLLQHTSGLHNYTNDLPALFTAEEFLARRFERTTPEEMVARALQHGPTFAPGAGWEYSNTNYALAGMVIERATGNDWRAEVRTRITAPLGLTRTFDPGDDPDLPEPHARGYELFEDSTELLDVTSMSQSWADAAGSLVTTAADLTTFWRELERGSLLEPEQMAELHRAVPAPPFDGFWPGVRYGLGIMWVPTTCGGGYWSHGGDTLGFATRNAASDGGSRVVVISLSTQRADNALTSIETTFRLLDDLMCAD